MESLVLLVLLVLFGALDVHDCIFVVQLLFEVAHIDVCFVGRRVAIEDPAVATGRRFLGHRVQVEDVVVGRVHVPHHTVHGLREDFGPEIYCFLVPLEATGCPSEERYVLDHVAHTKYVQLFEARLNHLTAEGVSNERD